eukprot:3378613-Alexandrium_andersonii.AAC.1
MPFDPAAAAARPPPGADQGGQHGRGTAAPGGSRQSAHRSLRDATGRPVEHGDGSDDYLPGRRR